MAQCPNCSASVSDDFGLTECESCHAQLIVHMDGQVEFSDPNAVAAAVDESTPDLGAYEEPAYEEPAFEEPAYEETPYEETPYEETPVEESSPYLGGAEADAVEPAPPVEEEYNFDEPEPPINAPQAEAQGNGSPDLSDIAKFGNSEASGGRDGALRYNLRVTGIDTVDVREAFREALTDRKFVWDTDEILRSIKSGECAIENISSVKAHVLITRLRQLPVEVEWEQYAIHQT